MPTAATAPTATAMMTTALKSPLSRPSAASMDMSTPGTRATFEMMTNLRMGMSVKGTRYVSTSFGMPGMRKSTNTMTSSFSDCSKSVTLSSHFSGIMSRTNGAPRRCTTAKRMALDITHPIRMMAAPPATPYIAPATSCTTSPGMMATMTWSSCRPRSISTPRGPAPLIFAISSSRPDSVPMPANSGVSATVAATMMAMKMPKPMSLMRSALVRRARRGLSDTGASRRSATFFRVSDTVIWMPCRILP